MYQDWLSTVQFKWTPILTYTRRYLALLDWFEENIEPVAFTDRPDKQAVGVALVAPDLRLVVSRSGMILESGLSGLAIEKLMPAVTGVFEVMNPSSVLATQYMSIGTVSLRNANYYEQCSRFGVIAAGDGFNGSDQWRVADGSALVDLLSQAMKVQVEWGVVESDELLERLRNPTMSRLNHSAVGVERASIARNTTPGRDVPSVSVYTDQVGLWRTGGGVNEVSDVMKRVAEAQQTASSIGMRLAEKFCSEACEGAR
ncbi:hypothetical protein [Mycobacteroides abscessus]|uniref:hypothetical protein n=1 Tax=Mycobacteroides abscessus TaxID=36809 RepID=UPI000C26447D|nr:hypothetical protein [Mycobacteroides abscessus]